MSESLSTVDKWKAVVTTLLAFLMLASVSVLAKIEMEAGAKTVWVVFVQYLVGLVIMTLISWKRKFADLRTKKFKYHLIRGITGILAFTFFIIAVSKIPLVNAALLNNTSPIFIPIISFLWLGVKIQSNIWWGILTGFAGIILILDPSAGSLFEEGDLFGLAAGILLAIAYVALGILTKTESFVTILFYYTLISVIVLLPFAITNWSYPGPLITAYAIITGVMFISYLYLLQFAYRIMPATKLAPLNFSAIVFTGILDWIVFGQLPNLFTVIGTLLVIAGGVIAIVMHEKDNKELKHHWH